MLSKKVKKNLSFWCVLYPFAISACFFLQGLCLFVRIKVIGTENLPNKKESLLIISPHTSFWETAALYAIFNPFYLMFHPKAIPWSTPDKEGLCDKWFWFIFRARSIPVSRRNHRGGVRSAKRIAALLRMGYNVILFPEGGRTDKGTVFLYTPSGRNRIRELTNGVGQIICRSGCRVAPVWPEGSANVWPTGKKLPRIWRQTIIRVGETSKFKPMHNVPREKRNETTLWAGQAMLSVAIQGER